MIFEVYMLRSVIFNICGIVFCAMSFQSSVYGVEAVHTEESVIDNANLLIEYAHNPLGWPALHYAIAQNREDIALLALQLYPEQVTQYTPALKLVDYYFDTVGCNDYDYMVGHEPGTSALELAVRNQYADLVNALLKLGANADEARFEYDGKPGDSWNPKRSSTIYESVKWVNSRVWLQNYEVHCKRQF